MLIFAVALLAGSLMVSRFRYLSGKDLDPKMRVPVAFMVLVPLGFVLVGSSPPEMLFALFAVYASSGPLCSRSGAVSGVAGIAASRSGGGQANRWRSHARRPT